MHSQSNGQVERANGLILAGIKPRLLEPLARAVDAWEEELPSILWSLRKNPNRSTGFTPFFLVHGAEAVMPTDIEHDAPRIVLFTEAEAKQAYEDGIDLLEDQEAEDQRGKTPAEPCQRGLQVRDMTRDKRGGTYPQRADRKSVV